MFVTSFTPIILRWEYFLRRKYLPGVMTSWIFFILFLSPPRRLVKSREMPKVTTEVLERVESASNNF